MVQCLSRFTSDLLLIVRRSHELCQVLQVQLRPSSVFYPVDETQDTDDLHFQTIANIPILSPVLCLRALDPGQSLLLLSLPASFHLLNWNTGERIVVSMLTEEVEELWNGVVGATFLTARHILVLKAHSIEICTLVNHPDPPHTRVESVSEQSSTSTPHPLRFSEKHMCAMVHPYYLPSTTFRGVSFARPTIHTQTPYTGSASQEAEPTKVSTSFLAFDVLRGLYHFSVEITLQPTPANTPHAPTHEHPAPIDVHIQLLSSHNMALPVFSLPTPKNVTYNRSGFSHGTRGFVSTCALGPTGRRGVWVERRRGAVRRVVYGFDASGPVPTALPEHNAVRGEGHQDDDVNDDPMDDADTDADSVESASIEEHHPGASVPNVLAGRAGPIDGRELYEVNSYDLRDDITHIAFAEATGLIALGTRKGEIRVLGRAGSTL
ncbi:hypothetical protein C8Q77DRAFT_1063076 [Trametes polyzona]|nr:hypothetical protein C8Q77DRAFT_1063076 [Trametes polyzona]